MKENLFENKDEKINHPDIKYEPEKNPERIEEIEREIKNPKYASVEVGGQKIQIEYIEISAKEKDGGKKVVIIIPGFSSSYVPFENTTKELARYMGNHRVICLSPLDSGKSSSLKNSNLNKMNEAYYEAFKKMDINSDSSEATVIGHSRSDIVVLELARSHPEIVKNIVLADGISGNKSDISKLALDFTKHSVADVIPARILGTTAEDKEAAKNYWIDFFKNFSNPKKSYNQFKSLTERKKINFDDFLPEIKSNVLILSGDKELTNYEDTSKKIYQKLPRDIKKQHRIEIGGLHDEIHARPEAFAIKLKRWLESVEEKNTQ